MISDIQKQTLLKNERSRNTVAPFQPGRLAVAAGLLMALAGNLLLPALLPLARLALFPAVAGVTLICTGFQLRRRQDELGWTLLIAGQFSGVGAALLFFLAALL